MQVSVECTFSPTGTVQVKRIKTRDQWQMVEQGRQWVDANGRHILIILAAHKVHELVLNPATLTWNLAPGSSTQTYI